MTPSASTDIEWEIDFELTVLDALDDSVSCEWLYCGQMAVWTWTHGCGEVWLYCEKHRQVFDRKNAGPFQQVCNKCDGEVPQPVPWEPL